MRVVATAGHVDHGKSSLVLAMCGTDPDRLAEEKRRGMTIELGFAHCSAPDGTVPFTQLLDGFALMAGRADDPAFGLHYAQSIGCKDVGILGYFVLNAPDLLTALTEVAVAHLADEGLAERTVLVGDVMIAREHRHQRVRIARRDDVVRPADARRGVPRRGLGEHVRGR